MDQGEPRDPVQMTRRIAAALMILPLVVGVATSAGVGDLLYPKVDEETLATARLGAWLAGVSVVVALALDTLPSDPRGISALTLLASAAGAVVVIGHDLVKGFAMSMVLVFFLPAALVALANVSSGSLSDLAPVRRAKQRLAWIGAGTGLVACNFVIEAGTRGLAADVLMIVSGLICAAALVFTAYVAWRSPQRVAAAATAVTAVLGLALLRDSFIAQAALLGGSAFLSARLAQIAPEVSVERAVV
jgi:hypothetical protein